MLALNNVNNKMFAIITAMSELVVCIKLTAPIWQHKV